MTRVSPIVVSSSPPVSSSENPQSIHRAERAYQGLIIAAMILLLGSLGLFW